MSANPATIFTDQMTFLTGNNGGNIQTLPQANLVYGKIRNFVSFIALASQVSGSIIGVARLPIGATFLGIDVVTDTSLGSSTIAFGDAGSGNTAIYGAAATVTTTNAVQKFLKEAVYGVPITSGFDCVTGVATGYTGSSGSGALYEDITMTVATANLPSSGNLKITTNFCTE